MVEYNVYCTNCVWTGDRDDYLNAENSRCPDCNAPLHLDKDYSA